jgi:hypothetical protein
MLLRPGQLWSLWDLMHKLKADHFFKAYEQASVFHQALVSFSGNKEDNIVTPKSDIERYKDMLHLIKSELAHLGMTSTSLPIQRSIDVLDGLPEGEQTMGRETSVIDVVNRAKLQRELREATSRISDDFSMQEVLVVDSRTRLYYNNPKLFGEEVFTKFHSANEDIAEAGTCLSLDRGTACVLHLNRALEVSLRALAAAVGVGKKTDWGKYISEIGTELERRMKTSGSRTEDEQFYAEGAANFDALRRAYRNPTMHPEKNYSVDRAQEILLATKSFMSHLAGRISEDVS